MHGADVKIKFLYRAFLLQRRIYVNSEVWPYIHIYIYIYIYIYVNTHAVIGASTQSKNCLKHKIIAIRQTTNLPHTSFLVSLKNDRNKPLIVAKGSSYSTPNINATSFVTDNLTSKQSLSLLLANPSIITNFRKSSSKENSKHIHFAKVCLHELQIRQLKTCNRYFEGFKTGLDKFRAEIGVSFLLYSKYIFQFCP